MPMYELKVVSVRGSKILRTEFLMARLRVSLFALGDKLRQLVLIFSVSEMHVICVLGPSSELAQLSCSSQPA